MRLNKKMLKIFWQLKALQQKDLTSKANEQAKILEETKGKEAAYQAMLAESRKKQKK